MPFLQKEGSLTSSLFQSITTAEQINEQDRDCEQNLVEDILKIYESHVNNVQDQRVERNRAKITYKFKTNNSVIVFEIDSGAPVSIISLIDAKKYFGMEKNYKSDTVLYSYCHTALKSVGYIIVKVDGLIASTPVKLYIVKSQRNPLLGREWLRIVKLDWSTILKNEIEKTNLIINNLCSVEKINKFHI